MPVHTVRMYVCMFSLILVIDSSVGLSAGIQSAGDSVPKTLVQILHSAEEYNMSPFVLKIACLCQSIINNNKHVYRQSQVRKPNGSEVEWAECSLIIGTDSWAHFFLAWSSIAQSVCQRAFSLMEIQLQRPWFKSCIQQRKATCLHSIWKSLAWVRASKLTTTNMSVWMYIWVRRCVFFTSGNMALNGVHLFQPRLLINLNI